MNARTSTTVTKLTMNRSQGSVKTKNPTSIPNCGSSTPKGSPVRPEEEGAPGAHGPGPGEQAEDDGDDDDGEPAQRLDGLAVLLEHLLGLRDGHVQRAGAVGDDETGADRRTGEERGADEDGELGRQLLDEHRAEADGVVPPDVGEEVGRDAAQDDHGEQDDDRRAERPPPAPHRGSGRSGRAVAPAPGACRTVIRTRRPVEPLRATHCSPRPVGGVPRVDRGRRMYPGFLHDDRAPWSGAPDP